MKSKIFDYVRQDGQIRRGIGNDAMVNQVGNSEKQIISTLEVEHTEEDREQITQMDEWELSDVLDEVVRNNPLHKFFPN